MYYIQMQELQSDTSFACLIWRIVKGIEIDNITITTPNKEKKMKINYTSGGLTAELEINVVKQLTINNNMYDVGFLDDNYFLYQADRRGIDEAYQ